MNEPVKLNSLALYTLLIISMVQFLNPFMATAVGIALPAIGVDLNASATELGMIETIYLLAVTIFLIPFGKYADLHGRKKIFTAGIIVFTLATALLIFTSGTTLFISIRFLQGIGASMITTTGLVILTTNIPVEKRGWAMGVVVACIYMATSAGPTISGFLVSAFGWRSIFILTLPLEIFLIILTIIKLKVPDNPIPQCKFNWKSSTIFMVSMSAVVIGTTGVKNNIYFLIIIISGITGIIYFLKSQKSDKNPLLNTNLFKKNISFTYGNLVTFITYASSFGSMFLFSIYLQNVMDFTPKKTGLIMITQPLIQIVFSYISGTLSDKISPAKIATTGMLFCAAGLIQACFIDENTSMFMIYTILMTLGTGFGLFSSSNLAAIMDSVSRKDYGTASSIIPTMRTTGMLVSMTVVTIFLTLIIGDEQASENPDKFIQVMRYSYLIFIFMILPGIYLSYKRTVNSR